MKKLYVGFLVLLAAHYSQAADYFWVGDAGNWSDLTHWANASGGAGSAYGSAPTTADNVFFDANSFSVAGQTVTLDVDGDCANLSFTGATNTPTFSGAATRTLTVAGNMTLIAGITYSHVGNVDFVGTGVHTITSAGQTFGGDILFNGVGGSWTLTDALIVTDELGVENGTFDMAGFAVTCGSIDANKSVNVRSIDFDASAVTITNNGTSLDLRGNTTNFTTTVTTSTIDFTATGNITIETGDQAKTLPSLTFSTTTGTIQVNTGSVEDNTNRITFGNITVTQDNADFRVDGNNDNSNIKTYGNISLPADCDFTFGSGDGSGGYAGTNHTIFSGTFDIGDNCDGIVRGRFLEFQGAVTFTTNADCNFVNETQFLSTFDVTSTAGGDILLNNDAEFDGLVSIHGNAEIFLDIDINFNQGISVDANSDALLTHRGTVADVDITNGLTLGANATLNVGNGVVGTVDIDAVTLGSEAQIDFSSGTGTTTIGDLTLSQYNIVRFNTAAATSVTGTLTSSGDCSIWLWLKSLTNGAQASVSFSSAQGITSNICQDINCTSTNLTNTNGVDLSNNTGITFTTATTSLTFFWVGSTTGNTKTGTFTTGVNDNWSNPDNWSLTSGTYTGTNQCIPGAHDSVVFDANSFSAGAGTVDMDLFVQACQGMTWTGVPAGCTIDGSGANTNNELIIFGALTLHSNVDNQFEGTTTFSAHNSGTKIITMNNSNFFGNVDFDFNGGNWQTADGMDLNGEQRADLTILNGTLDANGQTHTIEDDWTVQAGATFTANGSTITFDGPASQTSRQEVTSNGNSFHTFHVNRGTNGGGQEDMVRLLDAMTVTNDLDIDVGGLEDNGNQITGNNTGGQLTIANGARLIIGNNGTATVFPTNYTNANITLSQNSRVHYNSRQTQTISSVPTYGRLYLTNTNSGTLIDKSLDGPTTINDLFFINDDNHFIDAGFQVTGSAGEEVQMDPRSKMTLGTAASATQFPLNFTVFDIRQPTNIVYNSGLAQTIKGLSGGGTARYDTLTVTNAAGVGTPVKTLDGNAIVRSDLIINANNEVDADVANDFDIELLGNWINSGTFTPRAGQVSFTGTNAQTLTSGGSTENFYDITINNTAAGGLTINDDIEVAGSATFTDGVIFEGDGANEIVRFLNGASVAGSAIDASHVDGRVEKVGVDAFEFPVGDLGVHQPISITAPTTVTTTFRAEYFNFDSSPTFDDTQLDPTIHHISDCEWWQLDELSASGDAVQVTLGYKPHTGACSGVTDPTSIVVARWDGATWRDEGGPGTVAPAGTVTSGAISTFSPFTLASTDNFPTNPLPVELLSFNAIMNGGVVDLDWTTATEINNDYFVVERSADGETFEDLFSIDGAGNSSGIINYFDRDLNPLSGVSYYRLRQVDFDGSFTHSHIVPVQRVNPDEVAVSLFPNPVGQEDNVNLLLSGFEGEEVLVVLRDISGREFYSKVEVIESGQALKVMPITHDIPAGVYLVIASSNDSIYSKRLVIE